MLLLMAQLQPTPGPNILCFLGVNNVADCQTSSVAVGRPSQASGHICVCLVIMAVAAGDSAHTESGQCSTTEEQTPAAHCPPPTCKLAAPLPDSALAFLIWPSSLSRQQSFSHPQNII